MTDREAIVVENLRYGINGRTVLENVNLRVEEGAFMALIGPNGGGKTTLIKLMVGLLRPDAGTVRVLGDTPAQAAHRLGYVPQDVGGDRRFPITVMNVVLMGRLKPFRFRPGYPRSDHEAARRALEQMEMWSLRNRPIDQLSGGQRQRVMIARALATEPEILFLDEPTASVDTKHQSEFYEILSRLNRRVTIVIVCHDLMLISSHVRSVACVNRCVHYHDSAEITQEMIDMYHCPVDLIAHGLPHRVFRVHEAAGQAGVGPHSDCAACRDQGGSE